MRNVHRLLSTAFGPRIHSGINDCAVAATPTTVDSRPYGSSGKLISTPWEGLYLELDD